jgi:hypothetical protein
MHIGKRYAVRGKLCSSQINMNIGNKYANREKLKKKPVIIYVDFERNVWRYQRGNQKTFQRWSENTMAKNSTHNDDLQTSYIFASLYIMKAEGNRTNIKSSQMKCPNSIKD